MITAISKIKTKTIVYKFRTFFLPYSLEINLSEVSFGNILSNILIIKCYKWPWSEVMFLTVTITKALWFITVL